MNTAGRSPGRMRDKLTKVNASIATNDGMDLWKEAQDSLTKMRK